MDGHSFVLKLESLGVCPKDRPRQSLRGDDFDWIFVERNCGPLISFWRWIFANVGPEDVLDEQELTEYEDLVCSGSVLSAHHLKQIEAHIGSSVSEVEIPQLNFKQDEPSQEDVVQLEMEAKKLQNRKNILSLQRMEVESKLNEKRDFIRQLKCDLELQKRRCQVTCNDQSKAIEDTAMSIEDVASVFEPFEHHVDECRFLSQIRISKWLTEEHSCKDALTKYIYKQFQEGVEAIAGLNDSSSHHLLDSGQLDLQFVRGPKEAEYERNTRELRRINAMLEETELEAVDCCLLKAQKSAEIAEALKFLKALKSKPNYSHSMIKQQLLSAEETKLQLEQDLEFQTKFLRERAVQVAQMERLRVVSGNFRVKLKRQEYYLSKLHFVKEHLLQQLSRLDFVKIVFDIEKQKIETAFRVLGQLNKSFAEDRNSCLYRLEKLKSVKESFLKGEDTASEWNLITSLVKSFDTSDGDKPVEDLAKCVNNLELSLKNSEQELNSNAESRMNLLTKLVKSCSTLEECLFGTKNSLGTLPVSWIDFSLTDRLAKIEQKNWELLQDMLSVLKQYEQKKKVLGDRPTLRNELMQWAIDYSER